jgi:hypothetical protein
MIRVPRGSKYPRAGSAFVVQRVRCQDGALFVVRYYLNSPVLVGCAVDLEPERLR